jgi:hypothetical protein
MKRRVQRALVDLQDILGNPLDALGDRPSMERAGLQRAQDQQNHRAGKDVWSRAPRHGVGYRH